MFWRKKILTKMMLGIVLPVIIVFIVAAALILSGVEKTITQLTTKELTANSIAASNQVSEFFTKYQETVLQMKNNSQVVNMMREITAPGTSKQAPSYGNNLETFNNILASDSNIALVWTADFDSGESIRSGGAVKGMPDYDITSRDWYTLLKSKNEAFITTYPDSSTGELVASVIEPVVDGSSTIGCTAIDITVSQLTTIMEEYRLGENGYFVLVTDEGMIAYHPTLELIGKDISEAGFSENITTAIVSKQPGDYLYSSSEEDCAGYLSAVSDTGWSVLTVLPTKELYSAYKSVEKTIFVIFSVGLIIMIFAIVFISAGIVRPLKRLSKVAHQIADGDLNVAMEITSIDETGQVAMALERTIKRLKDYIIYIDEIAKVLNEIAEGNMTFKLENEYVGEFSKIKDELLHISTMLTGTLGKINITADQVASGSSQVSIGAMALSQGATEQASTVEELAAAISLMSSHINKNADNAVEAKNLASKTGQDMHMSTEKMSEMIVAMDEIGKSSDEIGKIIKTIEDIAFQTNILALNAAVEAARAGEAGKGFAVVADEVRNLASKSAEAAKTTSSLIQSSISAIGNGAGLANAASESLSEVAENAKVIIEAIDKISDASLEQAESIKQVTLGVDQISSVVQTNSATAEESAAASEELSAQAQTFKELVSTFKLNN